MAGFKDFLEHQANIALYFFISKSNDPIAKLFELVRPLFILFSLQVVDVAVNLYHQSSFRTVEIGDKWSKWMLAAEFQTKELTVAQALPKQLLGSRHFLS